MNKKLLNTIKNWEVEETKLKTKLKKLNSKIKEKKKLDKRLFLIEKKLLSAYIELSPCPYNKIQIKTAENNVCVCDGCSLFRKICECEEKCWCWDDSNYTIDEQIKKWKNNEHSISELCDYCETRKEHNLKIICECEDCELNRAAEAE